MTAKPSYEELERRIEELEKAESERNLAEYRLIKIFDNAQDAIFIHDLEGKILDVNDKMCRIYGLTKEEALEVSIEDVSSSRMSMKVLQERWKKALNGEKLLFEWEARRPKDESVFNVEVSIQMVRIHDKDIILANVRDITERKRAEEVLREREEKYRLLFNMGVNAMFLVDNNTTQILECNNKASQLFGYSSQELLSMKMTDLSTTPEATRRACQENVSKIERVYRKKKGGLISVDISSEHFYLANRAVHLSAIRNITDKKHAEKALREKTKFLQNIIDTISDLVSVTDMEGNFKFLNPSFIALGYDPDSLVGRNVMEFVHPDDYQKIATAFADFLANREDGRKVEYRYLRADGDYLWFETVGKFILDDAGNPKEILFRSKNFTARKRAEGELKRIEWMLSRKPVSDNDALTEPHDQGYGDLTELNQDGIILKSIGHERLKSFANDYLELLGTSSAIYEVHGDYAFGIFASGWCRMMDRASRTLCNTSDNVEALTSGRWLCHESCWTDCSKEAIAKRAPVDLECNGGIRLYAVPIFAGGNVIGVINFGYGDPPKDPEKLKMLADIYHLNHDDLIREATAYDSRPPYIIEMAKKRLNSTAKLIGSMVETKQAVEALRESETRFKALHNASFGGIAIHDQGVILECNQGLSEMTGYQYSELIGMDGLLLIAEQSRKEVMNNIRAGYEKPYEAFGLRKNGEEFPIQLEARNVPYKGKQVRTVEFRDITERKLAEMELQSQKNLLEGVLDSIKDIIGVQLPDHKMVQYNRAGYELLGLTQDQVQGKKCYELIGRSDPCDICTTTLSLISRTMETRETFISELGRHFLCTSNPVLDDNGNIKLIIEQLTDITEKKKVDEQLHQAQKMESVGRLAGGVAHDFNNMLGVILGHTELALLQADENHDLYSDLKEIQKAAKRSANLTKQLLTFARKDIIAPKQLDLNDTVESMLNMLRRLIGEDIDLIWKPSANLWPIKMDPSQIDQILANLCVNARDAIPGVGKLTIETGKKSFDEEYCKEHAGFIPGDFVLLAVSDNGCGMDKETLDNLFEPFFTTKEVGKGTGLGLATIYGIVKQNNGFINVYSEPGRGSTFKVYLPRFVVTEDTDKAVPVKKAAAGGSETILLVEDEPSILRMTRMMLERKGYSVLAAATPGEAIRLAKDHTGKIHLLMTDVVMPEMNGRDLAGQLIPLYPEIKLLFMSGYTSNVIAHHGVLDKGVAFIQKPFSMADMTEKVREVLDMASDKN